MAGKYMQRNVMQLICRLVFLILLSMSAQTSPARSAVILDSKGNVRSFYGVPVTLTRSGLKRLHFPVKVRYERGDDDPYPVYTITAEEGVEVEVTFEEDGKLYGADTVSPHAVGPKGIGVGSTLADVKTAWPKGVLLFGSEDGYFVTYVTGTNILFRFNPKDMHPGAFNHDRSRDFPVPDNIKVQTLSIYPEPNPIPEGPKPVDPDKNSITIENSNMAQ